MRVLACYLIVAFLSAFAYKRWFVSLCGAIVMMAILEHPDMPKSIGGIQGLNLWNILFANVMIAWWRDKCRERRQLDFPVKISVRLMLFIGLIIISTMRMLLDPGLLGKEESFLSMVSEFVINCFKWLLPGLLLFDGCRTRRRTHIAIACILLMYFLLGAQVVRWVPLGGIASERFARIAYKMCENEIGYNRVTLSMMLGGASWAMISALGLVQTRKAKLLILAGAFTIMLGQALTGGRTGYGCWVVVGLTLCTLRWRKLLLLIPIAGFVLVTFVPGVRDRLMFGMQGNSSQVNEYELTSGRNLAWPKVIEHIEKAPIVGHGRQAMIREGIRDWLWYELAEAFPHPHNAYLESWLDNGLIGLLISLLMFSSLIGLSFKLFKSKGDPLPVAIGGMCISLVLALLLGSFGGQTWYPREGSVCMWATVGLMLRVYVQWDYSRTTGYALFADEDEFEEDPAAEAAAEPIADVPDASPTTSS